MRYVAVLVTIMLIGVAVYQVVDCRKEDDNGLLARKQPMSMKGGYRAYLELVTGERLVLDSTSNVTTRIEGAVIKAENKGTVIVDEQKTDSVTESVEYNRLVIPRGGEYKIVLADGSQVWINSQSVLEFPACFVGKERRVRLQGEAYFEVTKDTARPFIVEANGMEVKVYGTQFNVNTRRDDQIQTTLVEGAVSVKPKGLAEVMLKPNQQAVFNKFAGRVTVRDVDVLSYVAWQRGNYYFENKSIGEILDELSLWYDIQVFFMNNEVRNERFSGYLPRYEEIDELLSLIEKTSHVRFEIKGRVIVVRK